MAIDFMGAKFGPNNDKIHSSTPWPHPTRFFYCMAFPWTVRSGKHSKWAFRMLRTFLPRTSAAWVPIVVRFPGP